MSEYLVPAWWCVLQTTVVACLGGAAAWALARRSPTAAATAATAAVATILALTLLAPAPTPRLALFDTTPMAADASDGVGASTREDRGNQSHTGGGVDLSEIGAWLSAAMRDVAGRAKPQAAGRVGIWLAAMGAAGAAVGLVRLAMALWYVRRLRRRSTAVRCETTLAMCSELAARLGLQRPVKLVESTEIVSPAVLGWRRPAVLLPAVRADWTAEQLRATLAHELAHIVRGDFAWRALASVTRAIHFVHPLVHLLTRRLALLQELAADELAATAAGGRRIYLRALSELAVRLDDQLGLRVEPLVLPTFSSFLMRRIAMLRSKDGSAASGRRSWAGLVSAAVIVIVGAGAFAMRGEAEVVASTVASDSATPALFGRRDVDVSSLLRGKEGLFIVRVNELSEQPAFAPLVQIGNVMINQELRGVLGGDSAPTLRLEAIEWFAGELKASFSANADADGQNHGDAKVSCEEFIVRFVDPVDWRAWIKQHMPGAEEVNDDGFHYVQLPAAPMLFPVHPLVAQCDERTLAFSVNPDRLRALAAGGTVEGAASLDATLETVHGGLATLVADASQPYMNYRNQAAAKNHEERIKSGDPTAAALETMAANVTQVGMGFDLDRATNRSEVRATLGCPDEASAKKVQSAIESLMPLAKACLATMSAMTVKDDASARATEQQGMAWCLGLIDSTTVSIEKRANGMVDVRLAGTAPFPSALVTAAEVAEAGDAPRVK